MVDCLTKLANDKEVAENVSVIDQVKFLSKRLGLYKKENLQDPITAAQTALSSRAADEFCALTDKLIAINSLKGKGVRKEILEQLDTNWNVAIALPTTPAAIVGAIGTGAIGGLAGDVASGGISIGLGTLLGTVVGSLSGAGFAIAYNRKKDLHGTSIMWSDTALHKFLSKSIILYLTVAHFGRGRGSWESAKIPEKWLKTIAPIIQNSNKSINIQKDLTNCVRNILISLYRNSNS